MINCERAGVKRFVIAAPSGSHPELARAMGRFRDRDSVSIVESFADVMSRNNGHAPIDPAAPCVAFSGNLVFAKSHLARILDAHAANPESVHRAESTDRDRGGEIFTGPIGQILDAGGMKTGDISASLALSASKLLPFALNGRPEDREEAELRLAQAVR
ncbi:MAG: hypothetical protein QOK03_2592, partial [Candidatus Binataceae bacterium]|nr:hypothetical protein [Candidatus Binataceae bacterium]